jgi:curved DNA-binding protein CbpA
MAERVDLYAVLGVPPTATQEEIRHAFRALMRRLHPDTRDSAATAAAGANGDAAFQRAVAAYAVLGDPQARADYDRTRRGRATPGGQPVAVHRTEPPRRAGEEVQPASRVGQVRGHRT